MSDMNNNENDIQENINDDEYTSYYDSLEEFSLVDDPEELAAHNVVEEEIDEDADEVVETVESEDIDAMEDEEGVDTDDDLDDLTIIDDDDLEDE